MILVVGMRLGCLNHALLTREAIRSRGLRFAGWVANRLQDEMPLVNENIETLTQRFGRAPLGTVPAGVARQQPLGGLEPWAFEIVEESRKPLSHSTNSLV